MANIFWLADVASSNPPQAEDKGHGRATEDKADAPSPRTQPRVEVEKQTSGHADISGGAPAPTETPQSLDTSAPEPTAMGPMEVDSPAEPAKPAEHVNKVDEPVESAESSAPPKVAPDEAQQVSSDADEEGSDGYEPPEAISSSTSSEDEEDDGADSHASSTKDSQSQEDSDNEARNVVSTTSPITQPISTGQQESKPGSPREVVWDTVPSGPAHRPTGKQDQSRAGTGGEEAPAPAQLQPQSASQTSFVPYETPLRYFRAYRFHPKFQESVPGGLRSLTYSNKIDVKKELCPDELAGSACPRGNECDYQHFESIQAPGMYIL